MQIVYFDHGLVRPYSQVNGTPKWGPKIHLNREPWVAEFFYSKTGSMIQTLNDFSITSFDTGISEVFLIELQRTESKNQTRFKLKSNFNRILFLNNQWKDIL